MSSILLDSTPPDIEVTSVSVATLVATPPAIEEFHNEHREQQTTEQPSSIPEAEPVKAESAELPDPFALGKAKLAEFWPIYVKEADEYDKELSEGWNKMLDVILIFAALFSAISTAFVLQSSQDLKPDPSESAAATLLIISQTLLAMSNQSAASPVSATTQSPPFTPSRSAVAVNVLWFTSLILSVSVTLIAMLAKEWSHFFMAGRNGLPMDQARKRQKRFDGMKAWKLTGVITALPTLMHIALFLFSAGLCVYLWDIHVGVAIPVVVLTLITVLFYLASLILPLIYDFCPYATALSKLIKPYPGTWSRKREERSDMTTSEGSVPMDGTTSRALAWLISNSEIPASVDLSFQAIAGASHSLPTAALRKCNAHRPIFHRLLECFGLSISSEIIAAELARLEASDPSRFSSVLVDAQALVLIAPDRQEDSTPDSATDNDDSYLCHNLDGLYHCLSLHKSSRISAIGYAGLAISRRFKGKGSCRLLDLSQHAVVVSKNQGAISTDMQFANLWFALYIEAIQWKPSEDDLYVQRPDILRNMLAVFALIPEEHVLPEFSRAVFMVALAMNLDATTLLGDTARHLDSFSDSSRHTLFCNLSKSLLPLGLVGILQALQLEKMLETIEASQLVSIFSLLLAQSDYIEASDKLPSSSDNSISTNRYVTETLFACHQQLSRRGIQISDADKTIAYGLGGTGEPWCTPMVTTLLGEPASNWLRCGCVHFVAGSQPRVAGISLVLLSNAVYEAVRLEMPGRTDLSLYIDDGNILRLTQCFDIVSPDDGQDVRQTVRALLQRLLQDDLFSSLIIRMFGASWEGPQKRWRGTKVAYTVQFWGEHIIQLGRTMMHQNEGSGMKERLRAFFDAEQDMKDVDDQIAEGARSLKTLLWREINRTEDLPATLVGRIGRRVLDIMRYRAKNHEPVAPTAESV